MRKKKSGKVLTAALTAAMIMSLGVPAMAATISDGTGPDPDALGTVVSSDTTLTIPKGIVLYNEEAGNYFSPTITYNYGIAPATAPAGATVTDKNSNVARVHSGVANGVSVTTQPSFTSESTEMDSDGEQIESNIILTVDLTKFTSPGVYRYELTDNTAQSVLYAAGMERESDYQTNRFVDVYITRNADGSMGVSGYVLLKNNDSAVTTGSDKSEGYVQEDDTTTAPVGFDTYETYNVTLEKDVEGAMGDRNHEFPFSVTIANNVYNYTWGKGTTTYPAPGTTAISSTTPLTSTDLKHNDKIFIYGLNAHSTISYTEQIDVDDVYDVEVKGDSNAVLVASATKERNGETTLDATHITNYESINTTTDVTQNTGRMNNVKNVKFINTMDQVSPTGLAFRFAPYLMMIAVGGILLAAFKRRKGEQF